MAAIDRDYLDTVAGQTGSLHYGNIKGVKRTFRIFQEKHIGKQPQRSVLVI